MHGNAPPPPFFLNQLNPRAYLFQQFVDPQTYGCEGGLGAGDVDWGIHMAVLL
jgi:hypothetical protein